MRRQFKDKIIQGVYDSFRRDDPSPDTRIRGACHAAYYVGRYVDQKHTNHTRGSCAYAAWAAGVDNARKS